MKIAGIGCGGLVGLLLLLAVIGAIIGPPKKTNTAATAATSTQTTAAAASSAPTTAAQSSTEPAPPSPSPTTASPKPSPVKTKASATPTPSASSCPVVGDIVVWYRAPTLPDSAQMLGGNGGSTCESTFDFLQRTSPTGDGYCTEAAWASDNPGYNADETPAKRIKKVQMWVGPAC